MNNDDDRLINYMVMTNNFERKGERKMSAKKDTNINRALKVLSELRKKHPELNNTELALELGGGYNTDLYKILALLLNEV